LSEDSGMIGSGRRHDPVADNHRALRVDDPVLFEFPDGGGFGPDRPPFSLQEARLGRQRRGQADRPDGFSGSVCALDQAQDVGIVPKIFFAPPASRDDDGPIVLRVGLADREVREDPRLHDSQTFAEFRSRHRDAITGALEHRPGDEIFFVPEMVLRDEIENFVGHRMLCFTFIITVFQRIVKRFL